MSGSGSGQHGLVSDFWPHIRLMQLFGFTLFDYHSDKSSVKVILRKVYAYSTVVLVNIHFLFIVLNFWYESKADSDLAAYTITTLFFAHSSVKLTYFAFRTKLFYRALNSWNNVNSHPLFAESHARNRAAAVGYGLKLLMGVAVVTVTSIVCWVSSTFFGESTKQAKDGNETISVEIPRLPIQAWYPWDAMTGLPYICSFMYQLYYMTVALFGANLFDLLFCCLMVFSCQQLEHIKESLKPLLDLSTSVKGKTDLFRVDGDDSTREEPIVSKDEQQINIRGIYSNIRDFGMNGSNDGVISTVNGPNGLNRKQDDMIRAAIKYWVERHKHIARSVEYVEEAYGVAFLLHMLISTVILTLLAFQATKVSDVSLFSLSVIGYLLYVLGQVFFFCLYGNEVIETSASVMEAAYNCQWYEGNDEAKTFIQIVCQQCQKSISISGAKFFTVSLDLFASVLGAVVTYFMVLVQLK